MAPEIQVLRCFVVRKTMNRVFSVKLETFSFIVVPFPLPNSCSASRTSCLKMKEKTWFFGLYLTFYHVTVTSQHQRKHISYNVRSEELFKNITIFKQLVLEAEKEFGNGNGTTMKLRFSSFTRYTWFSVFRFTKRRKTRVWAPCPQNCPEIAWDQYFCIPVPAEVSSITHHAGRFSTPVGAVTPGDKSRGTQPSAACVDSVSEPEIRGYQFFALLGSVFLHIPFSKCVNMSIYHHRISWVGPNIPKAHAHPFWSESVAKRNIQVLKAPGV